MGKVNASAFSGVASECSRWGVSSSVSGVSSGRKATATSMNSVITSMHRIYDSSLFKKNSSYTYEGYSVNSGMKIYSYIEDYIIGSVAEGKTGGLESGLLTYSKTLCAHCSCDSTCDAYSCSCDGAHECGCHGTCDGDCSCFGTCNGNTCSCNSSHSCSCHATSHSSCNTYC